MCTAWCRPTASRTAAWAARSGSRSRTWSPGPSRQGRPLVRPRLRTGSQRDHRLSRFTTARGGRLDSSSLGLWVNAGQPERVQDEAEIWRQDFGQRLRSHRTASGLSQLDLAHRVGLDPTYISGIERGRRNLSLVSIRRLAAALDVSPCSFFPQHGRGDSVIPDP